MKDYYKSVTTTLTPKRASAVYAIANRLCAVRDTMKHFDDYVVTELYEWRRNKRYKLWPIESKHLLRTIYVKFPHSNSLLAETVNDTLPSSLKGKAFMLVVHRKKRLYHYQFVF
jgi:hypothetical protein